MSPIFEGQPTAPRSHRPGNRSRAASAIVVLAALFSAGCAQLNFGDPFSRAEQLMKRGDYAGARTIYNELIDQKNNLKIAYANRCYANDALSKHEEAVHDCTASLEIDPSQPEVLNNRGVAYLKLGKRDEAEADFAQAIELRPDYAEAYANRGKLFVDQEEFEESLKDLDKAIELARAAKLGPVLSDAYGNRAMSHRTLGNTDQALADYTRAIANGNDPQAYWERGMFLYSMAYFDKAVEDMRAVLKYASPDSELHMMATSQVEFLESRPKGFDPVAQVTVEPGTPFPVPPAILTAEAGGEVAPSPTQGLGGAGSSGGEGAGETELLTGTAGISGTQLGSDTTAAESTPTP